MMSEFILNAIKFVLAVLMLPLTLACAVSLKEHFSYYPNFFQDFISWGILGFLLVYLFLHKFVGLYESGQKVIAAIFKFAAPLDRLISYLIPFYFILFCLIFGVVVRFFKASPYEPHFLFFIGFVWCMHVILASQELQDQESSLFKPSYMLWMSIIFIFNALLAVSLLDWIAQSFTLSKFWDLVTEYAADYYTWVFNKVVYFR